MNQCHNTIAVVDILTSLHMLFGEHFAIRPHHTVITQSFMLDMIQATYFKNLSLRTHLADVHPSYQPQCYHRWSAWTTYCRYSTIKRRKFRCQISTVYGICYNNFENASKPIRSTVSTKLRPK